MALRSAVTPVQISKDFAPWPTRNSSPSVAVAPALTAAAAVASMVFFILMQRANGNPDAGQELTQLYAPCGIYVLVALFSLAVAALSRRKLRAEKTAKLAAKAKAAQEKKAKAEQSQPPKPDQEG